jgi:PAS domain S-box-containing protein
MKKQPPKKAKTKSGSGARKAPKTRVSLSARKKARPLPNRHHDVHDLRSRLQDAEATIAAIRSGEVDALVINGPNGEQVFTLKGADHPYRVLVEGMNEGAITCTVDGTILYANKCFADMVARPLEKVMGSSLFEITASDSRDAIAALLRDAPLGRARIDAQIGDSAIPVQLSATPLDLEGTASVSIIVSDMRERLRSEQILASETLARLILDQAAEAMVVCDAAGRIIRANRLAIELSGQNPLGRSFEAAFPLTEDNRRNGKGSFSSRLLRRCLSGSSRQAVNAELTTGEGRTTSLLVSAAPLSLPDGNIAGAVITLTDITARVIEEHAQRFLSEISASLGESLDLATSLTTLGRALVTAVADVCSIEIIDRDKTIQRAVAAVSPEGVRVAISSTPAEAADGAPSAIAFADACLVTDAGAAVQIPWVSEHSEQPPHSLIVVPIRTRGKNFGAISLAAVSPARRYGEGDLSLARSIGIAAGHAIENAMMYAEAQATARSREEFISIASHELRTPLAALTLQLANMAESIEREPIENLVQRVYKASAQTHRLARIIDQLLDISRISFGALEIQLTTCDLSAIVRDMVERMRDQAEQAGSKITASIAPNVIGNWDVFRIEQVLTNLISNAIKYGAGKPIEVALEDEPTGARIIVRDNGIGIAPDDVERIFDRFRRSEPARYGGLGLGLFITRQIINAHRGAIRVESRRNLGSTFVVELPRDPRTAARPVPGASTV